MSNEMEMMNNEIITEAVEEVAETAKKSDNKFVKGFGFGIGTTIAAIAGIKYVLKPLYVKLKAKCSAKNADVIDSESDSECVVDVSDSENDK